MIGDILAQILSIILMNWTFFATLQGIVMFRYLLIKVWKKIAFFTVGTFTGICSSIIFVLSMLMGIAFVFGKEGSVYLSEYQSEHVFPLISIIILEFAEFLVLIFKFYMANHINLEKIKTSKVEYIVAEIKTHIAVFKKPNLAMIQ